MEEPTGFNLPTTIVRRRLGISPSVINLGRWGQMMGRKERLKAALEEYNRLDKEIPRQISTTDPESRFMKGPEGSRPSYNVQAAVDAKSRPSFWYHLPDFFQLIRQPAIIQVSRLNFIASQPY